MSGTVGQCLLELQARGLARLDAQLLMLHGLGKSCRERGWLLAHDHEALDDSSTARLQALAQRRLSGVPLAYLTGVKEFYGLALHVTPQVLVPRPETETLVDWALECLADRTGSSPSASQACAAPELLDLGTGSGAIALALKAARPAWRVSATDQSDSALALAQANAQRLALSVQWYQGSWFAALPGVSPGFDCILSNPPYIAQADAHLNDLGFEPRQALCSGADGLDDLRHIIAHASSYLKPGGWLMLEHGWEQAQQVRQLLSAQGFAQVQSRRDLGAIERCSAGVWAGANM